MPLFPGQVFRIKDSLEPLEGELCLAEIHGRRLYGKFLPLAYGAGFEQEDRIIRSWEYKILAILIPAPPRCG